MFNRSLLPPAQFEFVVISDTHYLDIGGQPIDEFKSRALQKDRIETILNMVASLDPPLIIHLGDLVMLYPARPEYADMMAGAIQQIERSGLALRHVAGNCDVGDKPDPLSPTPSIQPETLAWYHNHFGHSWYSFEHAGHHFVVLNAQLMNAPFNEAKLQRQWLEQDLVKHEGERIFIFLHMPPYLWSETEPALGHYEIIDEPGRSWLLNLVRQYQVEILVAGHVHFSFFDRIGPTRFHVLSTTSFGRDGFGYLFPGIPPERGRDDQAKLGYYLFRGYEDRTVAHFIRTYGATSIPEQIQNGAKWLVTRTSTELQTSPLGITLKHLLTETTATPIAWPSLVRRPIRNDYPLMGCLELGAKYIRVPGADLRDSLQSKRLAILREEGVKIIATALWVDDVDLPMIVKQHLDQVDGWEIQLPGNLYPSDKCLRVIQRCQKDLQIPITLSTIIPNQTHEEKYYPRTRLGYNLEELQVLTQFLTEQSVRVNRVLCRIEPHDGPWEMVQHVNGQLPLDSIGQIDFALELQSDDRQNAQLATEALLAMVLMPNSRLYIEPLLDIDRMIDVNYGLLDTLSNPRPVFHTIRCLNTILHNFWSAPPSFEINKVEGEVDVRMLANGETRLTLLLDPSRVRKRMLWPETPEDISINLYYLQTGSCETTTLKEARHRVKQESDIGPTLLIQN